MSSGSAPGQDAAAYCADLVRSHDFDGYAATLFVGAEQRRALLAIAAFNVEITRIPELVTQPLAGEIRLQWWSDLFAGTAQGGAEGHPVAAELLWAIGAYRLPTAPLRRLIEARQFDLYNDPMPDPAALQDYLDATVGGLLRLAAMVLAWPGSLRPSTSSTLQGSQDRDARDKRGQDEEWGGDANLAHAAHHAAVTIGMARLIAALPRDASRRRLFLPQQTFVEAGGRPDELFAGTMTPMLRAALKALVAEARAHFAEANALLAGVPPATQLAFLPIALAGRDLKRYDRPEFDPLMPLPRSRLATLWTLWRAARSRTFR